MKRTIRPGYYLGTRIAKYGTFGIQRDAYPLWGVWPIDETLKNITRKWLQKGRDMKYNNGGPLPHGLSTIANNTGNPEQMITSTSTEEERRQAIKDTWAELKKSLGKMLEDLKPAFDYIRNNEHILEHLAIQNGNRYWWDTKGQPRRTPGKKNLIHNGGRPR